MVPLRQIIYRSTCLGITPEQLDQLLESARIRNKRDNITGVLLYDPPYFMQVVEGPVKSVDRLFQDISCDSRHTNIITVMHRRIAKREFVDWSMPLIELIIPSIDASFFEKGDWQIAALEGVMESRAKRILTTFAEGGWHE